MCADDDRRELDQEWYRSGNRIGISTAGSVATM